jgi:molybdopterin synthase catalytic subunit
MTKVTVPRDFVAIQAQDFDVTHEMHAVRQGDSGVGAVASFVGTVRGREAAEAPSGAARDNDVSLLELEHYPGMTEQAIHAMIAQARVRFASVRGVRVIHRVGALPLHAQIVLVVVASVHRGEAFAACEFLMDYLKTQAPFWKKEHRRDGSAQWVDARVSDDAALQRWGIAAGNVSPHAGAVASPHAP